MFSSTHWVYCGMYKTSFGQWNVSISDVCQFGSRHGLYVDLHILSPPFLWSPWGPWRLTVEDDRGTRWKVLGSLNHSFEDSCWTRNIRFWIFHKQERSFYLVRFLRLEVVFTVIRECHLCYENITQQLESCLLGRAFPRESQATYHLM